jgi:hypothetical protein
MSWFCSALGGRKLVKADGKVFYPCQETVRQSVEAFILARALLKLQEVWPDCQADTPLTEGQLLAAGYGSPQELLVVLTRVVVDEIYSVPEYAEGENMYTDTSAHLRSRNSLQGLMREAIILQYAREAVRHADGVRMLRVYKLTLPRFLGYGAFNYSGEITRELCKFYGLYSPSESFNGIHDRFYTESSRPGHAVEKDLHIEHIIGTVKDQVQGNPNLNMELVAQKTETAELYRQIVKRTDAALETAFSGRRHTAKDDTRDVRRAAAHLISSRIFTDPVAVTKHLRGSRKNISEIAAEKISNGYFEKILTDAYTYGSYWLEEDELFAEDERNPIDLRDGVLNVEELNES